MRLNTSQKASLAITNRLFVNNWSLREDLMWAVTDPTLYDIKLEYRNKKPVGVALLHKTDGLVSLFVRKEWRRKGLGTKLLNRFKGKVKKAGYGVVGSEKFFEKVGVPIDRY